MNGKRTTINVQVTPEVKRRLEVTAQDCRMKLSDLVREMIAEKLPQYEQAVRDVRNEQPRRV